MGLDRAGGQAGEERSFLGLAPRIADLAERARSKKLKPDEASGVNFHPHQLRHLWGGVWYPHYQPARLRHSAIGGLKKEAAVLTDADGNDTIAIRTMQHFCLGFDHRTIDGADAGKFMAEFKKTLENWNKEIG